MGALTGADAPLAGRAVGVYGSAGAPWHHLALAALHGAEVRVVRAEDVAAGRLEDLDVLVVPGGGALAMAGLLAPLGQEGAERIRRWVDGGGVYVSSCAGSVLPLALADEAARALPAAAALRMVDVPLANPGDATLGGLASPGVGRIAVRVDADHPFARGVSERLELIHYNGPFFDLSNAPATVRAFAWPQAPCADFTPAERFLQAGAGEDPRDEDTVLARCVAAGAATAIEADVGAGHAVLFGSHPEFGSGPLALGWGAGAGLWVSAVRAATARSRVADRAPSPSTGGAARWGHRPEDPDRTAEDAAADAVAELQRASERFAEFAGADAGPWLDPAMAPSFHGRAARDAWRVDGRAAAAAAAAAAAGLEALTPMLGASDLPWLDDLPREDQDFGAMGLVQVARRVHAALDRADEGLKRPPQRPVHAYDLFDAHPFHLTVGSYLSAAGLAAAALLITVVLDARRGRAAEWTAPLLWSERAVAAPDRA